MRKLILLVASIAFITDYSASTSRRFAKLRRPLIQEMDSAGQGESWTLKGDQTLAYANMTHNYINSISAEDRNYIFDPDKPVFDMDHSKNITALLGKAAVLNCRVKNIGNKTVSWIRHRDIHLLTVGKFSYTSDQRFTAVHSGGSEDWLLKIHYLQERDGGWYECQISATPPHSHMIYLSVVEPVTAIEGGPDIFINTGSRLSLTCTVKYSPEPPAFIFWYHDGRLVSYDRSRGGIHIKTEKGHVSSSLLLIQYAEPRHSGLYTCAPANSKSKSVNVHIITGEKQAAIQHEKKNKAASGNGSNYLPFYCALSITVIAFKEIMLFG